MKLHVLEMGNGLTLLHREVPFAHVAHCGFVLDAGSRDEGPGEMGMAHFIEHMLFKGTQRRKNFHILNYLESVGGDLNAYTTKEKTCLYASLPSQYLDRAFDLLADITFHSTFPEKEMAKERVVISEEIEMYNDSPEEAILEQFDSLCFPNHPLGNPIAGTSASISRFSPKDLFDFTQKNFTQNRIVFTVLGPIPFSKVRRFAERYFKDLTFPPPQEKQPLFEPMSPMAEKKEFASQQTHLVLGGRACPLQGEGYYAFSLLQNLLGGPAMNSLLNFRIREKYGLTYNLYSFYSPYKDIGNWGIYFACDPANKGKILQLVQRELILLQNQKLSTLRLHQAQRQLIGQIVMSQENLQARSLVSAKNWLDFGKDWDVTEIIHLVEAVTASGILEAAQRWLSPKMISSLEFLPES